MFGKWLDEYRENYLKTRFISQLPAFLITLISLLSLYTNLHAGYLNPGYVESHGQYFWISNLFHVLVACFFGVRFVLLFFSSKKSFWFAQLMWLFVLITLFIWRVYTVEGLENFIKDLFPAQEIVAAPSFDGGNETFFSNISDTLQILLLSYCFLSPIRQFFTVVISVFKRW